MGHAVLVHRAPRKFLLPSALVVVALGCPEYDPQPYDEPILGPCLPAPEWTGRSCEEYCQDQSAAKGYELTCGVGPDCEDVAAVGFTRLDACYLREYAQPLSQTCTEPLPESLSDSVYFVSCCCVRP